MRRDGHVGEFCDDLAIIGDRSSPKGGRHGETGSGGQKWSSTRQAYPTMGSLELGLVQWSGLSNRTQEEQSETQEKAQTQNMEGNIVYEDAGRIQSRYTHYLRLRFAVSGLYQKIRQ